MHDFWRRYLEYFNQHMIQRGIEEVTTCPLDCPEVVLINRKSERSE